MNKHKLLFGICGIGRGHMYRQLPIISHFVKNNDVVLFTFGESFAFFSNIFGSYSNVKVFDVAVPWIHGNKVGIDFRRTADEESNLQNNFITKNFAVMDAAYTFFGKPNLIISDYEPVSAQFSYALRVPLVTIDQQSKYFYDGYPPQLQDLSPQEERARLNMFFPQAHTRIACSFFKPPSETITGSDFMVQIVPAVIRDEILHLKSRWAVSLEDVLVYLSPYSSFVQEANEVIDILAEFSDYSFHLFVSGKSDFAEINRKLPRNLRVNFHGNHLFLETLSSVGSAICTAGHTFISEMMFLNKPVYTVPLQTYEQKYNAKIISDHEFGVNSQALDRETLSTFLEGVPYFKDTIANDTHVLLHKESGQIQIVAAIEKMLDN